MICTPCKTGGNFNQAANLASEKVAKRMRREAKKAHKRCEYPSNCPCHHLTGQLINQGKG